MSSSSSGSGMSQAAGFAAQLGINLPTGQTEPNWVYPEIIESRTLAKSMLKHKFDTEEYGEQVPLLEILTNKKEIGVSQEVLEIIAVNKFLGMVDVSEDAKTSILTLNIHTSEPRLAFQINKTLISELDTHQRNYNKKKTSEAKTFIEERIIEIEKDLKSAEEALRDFTTRNRRIDNSALLKLEQERLSREVTVLIGVFTTLKQQLETTKIEEVKDSDYVVILDQPEIPLKRSKPNKRLQVILSGILGIGLGLFLALIREYFANSDENQKEKIIQIKRLVKDNLSDIIKLRFKK